MNGRWAGLAWAGIRRRARVRRALLAGALVCLAASVLADPQPITFADLPDPAAQSFDDPF
ncbi:MAG: hypothetical protein AAGC86_08955 [Pseudomonadota bacterium]